MGFHEKRGWVTGHPNGNMPAGHVALSQMGQDQPGIDQLLFGFVDGQICNPFRENEALFGDPYLDGIIFLELVEKY
jgi:hypothetical protein